MALLDWSDISVQRVPGGKAGYRPANSPWTDEAVAYLWGHARELSAGEMAAHLTAVLGVNITRNSVISKCHRSGISMCSDAKPRRRSAWDARRRKEAAQKELIKALAERREKERAAPPELPVLPIPTGRDGDKTQGVTLLELTARSCRFPLGDPKDEDFRFCGKQKAAHGPYCEFHRSLAYMRVSRKVASA